MKTQHAVVCLVLSASILAAALLFGETPSTDPKAILQLNATTANVAGAPDAVRIEILRWSTDEEQVRLMDAWNLKPSATGSPTGRGAEKGAAKQGKAAGRGRGQATGAASTQSPEAAFEKALNETNTVGYLWSSEIAGYALRYAGKVGNPDGSQRVVLITQRRLGAVNTRWKPTFEGEANSYEFSVIELHLNAKDEGEGRISLVGKVAPDATAKIVSVENYEALPAVLHDVHVQPADKQAKK